MALDKILVPLDGSELAERILVHVQRLLVRATAEVTLLRVVPEKTAGEVYPPGQNALALARRHVEHLRDTLVENGARVKAHVVVGDPATKILELTRSLEPSLVAMATHGRTGLSRFARGSVAERVLRRSTAPLFLANPLALPDRQPLGLKRILVPLDGSEPSAAVLPLAVEMARLFEAEIVLLSSLEAVVVPDPVVLTVSFTRTREEARALLEGFAKRVTGVPVRVRVAVGAPALHILEVAEEEKADLIALSTHGRSGFSRWAFGSVAEQVLRNASCPLLVKRTAGFLEDAGAEPAGAPAANAEPPS